MDSTSLSALTNTSTSDTTTSAAQTASNQLAGNFDTFLKLLTTQLQYQDPMSPMDSNEFTQQLVEFAGVEQSIDTNSNLEQLVNFGLANATSTAAGYIGKEVTAGGDTSSLANGSATWNYTLGTNAASTQITISDLSGQVVYSGAGETTAGAHSLTWDGRTNDGGTAPDGTYQISIQATDAGGNQIATSTNIQGTVSAVDIVNGQPMLNVGGISLPISGITQISQPTQTTSN
jgi:flagellar basal-body rod modification protein FlgD